MAVGEEKKEGTESIYLQESNLANGITFLFLVITSRWIRGEGGRVGGVGEGWGRCGEKGVELVGGVK